jgi:hypothetical protein
MLVWGGAERDGTARGDGAAYDPATNTWRTLPAASFSASGTQAAVWARDRWVVVDGAPDTANPVHLNVSSYRPDSNDWQPLPGVDVPNTSWYSLAWTGNQVVLFVNAFEGAGRGFSLWLGDPDPAWVPIAESPTFGLSPNRVEIWTGTEIVLRSGVQGGPDQVVAYHPGSDRWRTASPPPLGLGEGSNTWTGTLAIFGLGTTGMERLTVYDPTRDAWFGLPPLDSQIRQFATQTWTGERLIAWGGFEGESVLRPPDGFAFVPSARYVDAAQDPPETPTRLRVEVADASGTLVDVRTPTPGEVESVDRTQVGSTDVPAMAVPFGDRSIFVYWIAGGDEAARIEVGPDGRSIAVVAVPTGGEAVPIGHAVILTFDRSIGSGDINVSFWGGRH